MSPVRIIPSVSGLTTLRLDRPDRRHTMDAVIVDALTQAPEAIARNADMRSVPLA